MIPEPAPVKTEHKRSNDRVIIFLMLFGILFPLSVCVLSSLFLFFGFLFFGTTYRLDPVLPEPLPVVVEVPPETIIEPPEDLSIDFIDPELDIEISRRLIIDSAEKFSFSFSNGTQQENYIYERELILANIQYEYEQLSARFNHELITPMDLVLTDDQAVYELELGFKYDTTLPYAGVTKYRSIMILISPTKEYDKADLARLISHEIVHAFQFDSEGSINISSPLWFTEGTAEYFSDAVMYDPTTFDTQIQFSTLDQLNSSLLSSDINEALSAYLVAHHFIDHLSNISSEQKLIELMLRNGSTDSFHHTFSLLYNSTPEDLYDSWYQTEFGSERYSLGPGTLNANLMYNSQALLR